MDEGEREVPILARRYIWLGLAGVMMLTMLYLFYFYPGRGIGPRQPIYFSHRVHAGVKEIHCRFCHPYADRSQRAGIPEMAKCFYCHQYVIPTHPQIVQERRHYEGKLPVPWVRIYYVPDHVKFNHEPHIRMGIDCTVCHGDVKTMDRLIPVEFRMGFCIGCHKGLGAQVDCWLACHN
jgi:hypothetical protein